MRRRGDAASGEDATASRRPEPPFIVASDPPFAVPNDPRVAGAAEQAPDRSEMPSDTAAAVLDRAAADPRRRQRAAPRAAPFKSETVTEEPTRSRRSRTRSSRPAPTRRSTATTMPRSTAGARVSAAPSRRFAAAVMVDAFGRCHRRAPSEQRLVPRRSARREVRGAVQHLGAGRATAPACHDRQPVPRRHRRGSWPRTRSSANGVRDRSVVGRTAKRRVDVRPRSLRRRSAACAEARPTPRPAGRSSRTAPVARCRRRHRLPRRCPNLRRLASPAATTDPAPAAQAPSSEGRPARVPREVVERLARRQTPPPERAQDNAAVTPTAERTRTDTARARIDAAGPQARAERASPAAEPPADARANRRRGAEETADSGGSITCTERILALNLCGPPPRKE